MSTFSERRRDNRHRFHSLPDEAHRSRNVRSVLHSVGNRHGNFEVIYSRSNQGATTSDLTKSAKRNKSSGGVESRPREARTSFTVSGLSLKRLTVS